jgi:hypothetical protein
MRPCYEMEHMIFIKCWENHINIYATYMVCVFLFWIELDDMNSTFIIATYVCLSARHIYVHVPSQDLDF